MLISDFSENMNKGNRENRKVRGYKKLNSSLQTQQKGSNVEFPKGANAED